MDQLVVHTRTRTRGVSRGVYWFFRAPLQVFFHVYLRLSRIGREHFPEHGPAIIASNHRSFFDPFIIGVMTRRPLYYVAKRELFEINPVIAWLLAVLGAFPVDRGTGDANMIATAKELLGRGEMVLIFPEGTRTRPGPVGEPHRGVGRLAIETGAPVIPVAIIGTESIRRGWRFRPRKVRVRAGMPMRFAPADVSTPAAAAQVTASVWACVKLQWEWLGGATDSEPELLRQTAHVT
jgi:glycerol-3-phosphate dehydrogenase (NAD(P)+)